MAVRVSNPRIDELRLQDRRRQPERCLSLQEMERLPGIQAGDTVVCTDGVVWVTQAGDPQDYLLQKGEKFIAGRPGLVLIQALDDPACWCFAGAVGRMI